VRNPELGTMPKSSTKLWGGRFAVEPAAVFLDYSQSLATDLRMAAEDIWGSQAHVLMLGKQGILTDAEVREILRCLEEARKHVEADTLTLDPADEDIHMNLEQFVIRGAGAEFGGKLHTARSRNDQVVTDSRLHLRHRLLDVLEALSDLQQALLHRAEGHERTVMPGYTHTQHAQPISVAFWLTGHVAALNRDQARLLSVFDRADACPLGSCALAGTSFPTDRRLTARLLGFARVEEHALDAVGSRDIYLEALSALAILHAHLSRLCEELVLFSTYEFGMVELSDALTSGSSIMPQKKNPCLAELGVEARASELGFLDPLKCLERQRSLGSTGPRETKRMHRALARQLAAHQKGAARRRERVTTARARTAAVVQHVLRGGSLASLDL